MKSSKLLVVLVLVLLARYGSCQGARYIERQLLCALDRAPCDAWGSQVKAALPEIIGRGCENCDRQQVNNVKRIARFVQTRYPGLWAAIVDKYSAEDEQEQQQIQEQQQQQQQQYYEIGDGGR